jgi:Fe-Mn family superoxide dismutase
MNRREFFKISAGWSALALFQSVGIGCSSKKEPSAASLESLPYPANALEPHISAKTVEIHYGKHHRGYVDKTAKLIADTPYADLSLTEIIRRSAKDPEATDLFNNASQVFNHDFYWRSMTAGGGGEPQGKIGEAIRKDFGSWGDFAEKFVYAATSQFGSGWAWLVQDGDTLRVIKTANADNPIAQGLKPILTIDVWEHAYYLDYQNRRGLYVRAFVENLIDWKSAERNLRTRF